MIHFRNDFAAHPSAGAARPWTLNLLCKAELLTAEPSNRRHLTQARPLRHPSDVCVEPRHGRLAGGLSTRLFTGFGGQVPHRKPWKAAAQSSRQPAGVLHRAGLLAPHLLKG